MIPSLYELFHSNIAWWGWRIKPTKRRSWQIMVECFNYFFNPHLDRLIYIHLLSLLLSLFRPKLCEKLLKFEMKFQNRMIEWLWKRSLVFDDSSDSWKKREKQLSKLNGTHPLWVISSGKLRPLGLIIESKISNSIIVSVCSALLVAAASCRVSVRTWDWHVILCLCVFVHHETRKGSVRLTLVPDRGSFD